MARARVSLKCGPALADAERGRDREKWAAVAAEKRSLGQGRGGLLGQRKETDRRGFSYFFPISFIFYVLSFYLNS